MFTKIFKYKKKFLKTSQTELKFIMKCEWYNEPFITEGISKIFTFILSPQATGTIATKKNYFCLIASRFVLIARKRLCCVLITTIRPKLQRKKRSRSMLYNVHYLFWLYARTLKSKILKIYSAKIFILIIWIGFLVRLASGIQFLYTM